MTTDTMGERTLVSCGIDVRGDLCVERERREAGCMEGNEERS